MSGTEKLRPLLFGKSKKPQFFIKVKLLPLVYYVNKKPWMKCIICNLWLMKLDFKKWLLKKEKNLIFY